MQDRHPAASGEVFIVTIESTNLRYPQGVGVSEGVEIFGEQVKCAVIWDSFSFPPDKRSKEKSRLPFEFEIVCRNKTGSLSFYNMTEVGEDQSWWRGGSGMISEEIVGGRLYRSNDVKVDDDFDDLVFSVRRKVAV